MIFGEFTSLNQCIGYYSIRYYNLLDQCIMNNNNRKDILLFLISKHDFYQIGDTCCLRERNVIFGVGGFRV